MKRLLWIGILMVLGAASVHAAGTVWTSSNTATGTSGGLCVSGAKGFIHGVCVNTAAATSLTLYNSSWTTTGRSIGAIDTSVNGCKYYDTIFPAGLYLSKTGTGSVTILYDCL